MKYEYKVIYDGHSAGIEADIHQRILSAHGADGWELVSVVGGVSTSRGDATFVYYFKRPLDTPNQ